MNKKIYLDSAKLEEIQILGDLGIIQGVTTNPSIIAKEPKNDFIKLVNNIAIYCNSQSLSLSVEVFTNEPDEIIEQATYLWKDLSEVIESKYLAIKVPISFQNLKAIKNLVEEGLNINTTCCFTTNQMFLASILGSKYSSLFYCRLRDNGENPDLVLNETRDLYIANESQTEIIAGSIRTAEDVLSALKNGANIVTTSYKTISELAYHPKSEESIKGFLEDFKKWMN